MMSTKYLELYKQASKNILKIKKILLVLKKQTFNNGLLQ